MMKFCNRVQLMKKTQKNNTKQKHPEKQQKTPKPTKKNPKPPKTPKPSGQF